MFSREIRIGKILGVEIALDYSWFIVLILVIVSFSTNLLPAIAPGESRTTYFMYGIFGALLFFASVLIHELSHTLTARLNKLPINRITLFLFGGASNMAEEPSSAGVEFKMAIAGPIMSFILGILFLTASLASVEGNVKPILTTVFQTLGFLNIGLAIFNMIPGFPLDGGRVLRSAIWWLSKDLLKSTRWAANVSKIVAFLLFALGVVQIYNVGLFGGIWIILISFFLYQAASTSYQETLAIMTLSRERAGRLVNNTPNVIEAGRSIDDSIREILEQKNELFVIKDGEKTVGLIRERELYAIPKEFWQNPISDYMMTTKDFACLSANEPAIRAVDKLEENKLGAVPVCENNKLIGAITAEDIKDFLVLKLNSKVEE